MLSQKQVADHIKASVGKTNAAGRPAVTKVSAGHGLFLVCRDGKGYWTYVYRDGKRVASKGLGSALNVTPQEAAIARDKYAAVRRGATIPGVVLAPAGKSFATARDEFLAQHAGMWERKQATTYTNLLKVHAAPLDHIPITKITTQQVADCLRPIWTGPGHNRGSRLRGLIQGVINGHADPNPATWERLQRPDYGLEIKRAKSEGHKAMPAGEVPAFFRRLDMTDPEHKAIAFVLLTGTRRAEAVDACWREIDVTEKRWMIPGERMKEGKDFFVPLSDAALAVIGEPGAPDDFLFSRRGHDALSLQKLFGLDCVLHGFRTTFASWAEDAGCRTNVIQQALAHRKKDDNGHALGNQDLSYMRATLYPDRKTLMGQWADFVLGKGH